MIDRYSFSSVGDYLTCPQQFKFKHMTEAEPEESDRFARNLGSAVHGGIEAAFHGPDDPRGAALEWLDEAITTAQPEYTKARGMLRAYVPLLEIGETLKPLTDPNTGDPTIEHYFQVELPSGRTFSGVVDVLAKSPYGVTVIDWKTRGRFTDSASVRLDSQLYLYVFAVEQLFGLKVDAAYQVQLLSNPPAHLSLTQKGEPSRQVGKTTEALFIESLEHYNLDPAKYLPAFTDKIMPPDYFIRWSPIDPGLSPVHVRAFDNAIDRIEDDQHFAPVFRSNVYKWCDYQPLCAGQNVPLTTAGF